MKRFFRQFQQNFNERITEISWTQHGSAISDQGNIYYLSQSLINNNKLKQYSSIVIVLSFQQVVLINQPHSLARGWSSTQSSAEVSGWNDISTTTCTVDAHQHSSYLRNIHTSPAGYRQAPGRYMGRMDTAPQERTILMAPPEQTTLLKWGWVARRNDALNQVHAEVASAPLSAY